MKVTAWPAGSVATDASTAGAQIGRPPASPTQSSLQPPIVRARAPVVVLLAAAGRWSRSPSGWPTRRVAADAVEAFHVW